MSTLLYMRDTARCLYPAMYKKLWNGRPTLFYVCSSTVKVVRSMLLHGPHQVSHCYFYYYVLNNYWKYEWKIFHHQENFIKIGFVFYSISFSSSPVGRTGRWGRPRIESRSASTFQNYENKLFMIFFSASRCIPHTAG